MQEEQIQAYVFGELSLVEAEAIARAIQKDEGLQKLERQYRQIYAGLRAERIAKLEAEVLAFDQTLNDATKGDSKNSWISRRGWLLLALSTLAVLIGGFFYAKSQYADVALAERHFIFPQDPRVAGFGMENQRYQQALEFFFDNKNYPAASKTLDQLIELSPDYRTFATSLKAHALFLSADYGAAEQAFDQLLGEIDNYPRPQQAVIRWNAMMARLATGQPIMPGEQEWPASFPVEGLESDLGSWLR